MNSRSTLLLEHHLKELKLPSFLREYDKMAAQSAAEGVDHPQYLLRLAELELIDRHQRMVERRIRAARFPAVKTLDSFDFTVVPSVNKALVMELARCEYVRPDVGTGFGAAWPRARPTPLSTEPRRWRSRPASRYGSLRASAAAAFCPAGDGNWQKRRLRMVLGRLRRDGSESEVRDVRSSRGLLGGFGADLGRPLWLSLARWAGLRFCRQPAFGAALPRRAKENAGGIHQRLVSGENPGEGWRSHRSGSGLFAS